MREGEQRNDRRKDAKEKCAIYDIKDKDDESPGKEIKTASKR